jgi:SAM-dependent methyltransferase
LSVSAFNLKHQQSDETVSRQLAQQPKHLCRLKLRRPVNLAPYQFRSRITEHHNGSAAGNAVMYDEGRPPYPDAVFDDLIRDTELLAPARLLEIGVGSGIATRVLAERGFEIVGVELAGEMVRRARENLVELHAVEVIHGGFESFSDSRGFEAVVAFSAFHWIEPNIRYRKARELLRPGGCIAVADARFGVADARLAEAFERDTISVVGEQARQPGAPGVTGLRDELTASGFMHLSEHRYEWTVNYSTESFIKLLETVPWYLGMNSPQRLALYDLMRRRIETDYGGVITVAVQGILDTARLVED